MLFDYDDAFIEVKKIMEAKEKLFMRACEEFNMEEASTHFSLHDLEINEISFGIVAGLDQPDEDIIKFLEFLLEQDARINVRTHHEFPFRNACKAGHLLVAKWLYEKSKNTIKVTIYRDEAFRKTCRYGHLNLMLWLLQINNNIDIHAKNDYAFIKACQHGHYAVARTIALKDTDHCRITNENYAKAFENACMNDHLKIAKWLYFVYIDNKLIEIMIKSPDLFSKICKLNHVTIAKYLYSISKELKEKIDNKYFDNLFLYLCQHNCLETALWLASISPHYKLTFNQENNTIGYSIL